MNSAHDQLNARIREVADLRHTADLLEWDERVCMPSGGAPTHGEMLSTVRKLAHERFTAAEVGRLLDAAAREVASADPGADGTRLVAVTARDYRKATQVPATFVAQQAEAVSAAQHAWGEARAKNDFASFRPHLERVIALKRQYVSFFPPADHPYDVLLDDYEPGMKTAEVKVILDELRAGQVEFLRAIAASTQIDDSCLRVPYAEADLYKFAVEVITKFGFDWERGRQDKSTHPFATAIGSNDVRITTRFMERYPFSLLFGTMHETGHALYEQGVSRTHHRTQLEGGASLGVHESQSRLWENLVGRSRPFWEYFYPTLQGRFPAQLRGITLDHFYRAINKVQPSLIRVEADEATYNLHVMMRVELEMAVVEGKLDVEGLPAAWNNLMEEYLGVRPPDDATGVLQDIHWSAGLLGYFATYTLGNLISAQLWERFGAVHPERDTSIRRGDFSQLLSWLRSEVHQYGRKYQPQELVQRAAGSKIDPGPYLRYMRGKFGEIYGIGQSA
jgi:carboxypeptidase Taq